jgi:hypothetical protein
MPGHSPAPSNRVEMCLNALRLMLTVIRFTVKLISTALAFLIAFIAAMVWGR